MTTASEDKGHLADINGVDRSKAPGTLTIRFLADQSDHPHTVNGKQEFVQGVGVATAPPELFDIREGLPGDDGCTVFENLGAVDQSSKQKSGGEFVPTEHLLVGEFWGGPRKEEPGHCGKQAGGPGLRVSEVTGVGRDAEQKDLGFFLRRCFAHLFNDELDEVAGGRGRGVHKLNVSERLAGGVMINDERRQADKIFRNGSHTVGPGAINNDHRRIRIFGTGCRVQSTFELPGKMLDLAPVEWSGVEVPNKLAMRSIQEHSQAQRGSQAITVGFQMCCEIVGLVSGEEVGDFPGD